MPTGYRPIVVDNASTDDSAKVAAELGAVVVHEPQRGFGAACYTGLLAATSEVVCFMDCDASIDPQDLDLVSRPVADGVADLVLAARVPEKGAWPWHARVGNRVLAWMLRRKTGEKLSDLGPMRAARTADLIALGIEDRRFGWPLEMVVRAARNEWRILEVEAPYLARAGKSKVTGTLSGTIKAVRDMSRVLREL